MKFVHIADIHFDSPFVQLSDKDIMGDLRRMEQRKALKKIIEYVKNNNIPYLFISGDLYEHKYVKKTTIEYINNLFMEIPNTQVFIAPGNHDPKIKNSYYNQFSWNQNVKIFGSKIEKIENSECDIYGFGFEDFYCVDSEIENLNVENKNKLNILIMHGTIDGASIEEKQYNSISKNKLMQKGFNYVALGHIHKRDCFENENTKIVYPGSAVSLGFDELGKHGMIVGEIINNKVNIEFVPIDEQEFIEINFDIDEINSQEELIEKINTLEIQENNYAKIILTGKRNFEINTYEILKFILNQNIIKIKDKTKLGYDLEKIINDTTLKGLFAKEMKFKLDNATDKEKEIIEKAIEIGLEALE